MFYEIEFRLAPIGYIQLILNFPYISTVAEWRSGSVLAPYWRVSPPVYLNRSKLMFNIVWHELHV
jgi:hypothetical protein